MSRYFITISYDGSFFNGWQIQDNTPNTVQQLLEEKLSMVLQEKIGVVGCGRTDTGVNARNYVAHFDSTNQELESNKHYWLYKFNTVLPSAVSVQDIRKVNDNAHARYDAMERVYHYYIINRKDPFRARYCWHIHETPDIALMNEAAFLLIGKHDFSSFRKSRTQVKTNVCDINTARWVPSNPGEWRFEIRADRFLRGMVRAVVGTLVLIGRKKMPLHELSRVLAAKDRKKAGSNAPAHALFFTGVKYPDSIFS